VNAATLCSMASLLLGGELRGGLDLADRTQLSSRAALPGQRQTPIDVENGAMAVATLAWAPAHARLGYGPQYTLVDAFDERERARILMQTGFAGVSFGGRGYALSLNATGSLGSQSFSRLVSAPADPQAAPDPAAARVDFLPRNNEPLPISSLSGGATLSCQWSGRWSSAWSAMYSVSGGRGAEAQAVLPQQRTATAGVSTTYAASHTDQVSGSLEAVNTRTSNGLDYSGLGVTLGWSVRLAPRSGLRLSAGAIGGRQRQPDMPVARFTMEGTASGVVTSELLRARDLLVSLSLGASVAPQVASLTGTRQQRTQGAGTVTAQLFRRTTVAATVDATQTLPLEDPHEARILGAGLAVSQRAGDLVDLVAGYRSAWQQSRDPFIASLPRQWFAYIGLALRTPTLAF
jgi:hypothetical protein